MQLFGLASLALLIATTSKYVRATSAETPRLLQDANEFFKTYKYDNYFRNADSSSRNSSSNSSRPSTSSSPVKEPRKRIAAATRRTQANEFFTEDSTNVEMEHINRNEVADQFFLPVNDDVFQYYPEYAKLDNTDGDDYLAGLLVDLDLDLLPRITVGKLGPVFVDKQQNVAFVDAEREAGRGRTTSRTRRGKRSGPRRCPVNHGQA